MKKLLAFIIAMMFILTISVYAAPEKDVIDIVPENFGANVAATTADDLTWENGTVTAVDIPLFGMQLPKAIQLGETVVVKIKGTSDGDFRVWLLASAEKTFSNQYKMSENGYTSGPFEKVIELTAADFDSANLTEADNLCIKGSAYGVNIANLTIESIEIFYCTLDEYASEIDTSEVDAKIAEVEAKLTELEGLLGDLDAFEAEVTVIEEEYLPYFEEMAKMGIAPAVKALDSLTKKTDELHGNAIITSMSDSIKAVEDAYAKAKSSSDAAVLQECYNTAKEAADRVYSKSVLYSNARAKASELRDMAAEIQSMIDSLSTSDTTPAETEAPTTQGSSTEGEKSGCGSTMSASAVIVAAALAFGCAIVKKDN